MSDRGPADAFVTAGDPGALDALYRRFLDNPHAVPRDWARYFAHLGETGSNGAGADNFPRLAEAFRRYGHLAADLDPLGLVIPASVPDLDPARYGIAADDSRVEALRAVYCGTIGWEFEHIDEHARRDWLREQAEGDEAILDEDRRWLLETLARVDAFESFMGMRFPTAKRFGIEGGDSFICALETILRESVREGVEEAVMGGMHRGRLVLTALVAGKPFTPLLAEVKGTSPIPVSYDAAADVPYHLGHTGDREIEGRKLHVSLSPHPSHLEVVGAVTLGRARAKQRERSRDKVLPLLFHTDASFAGQGIVAEIAQMSRLAAFDVGGTIHVVVNNQVGFTTLPEEGRSARYCTDVAKLVEAPVLHVNGDDPEAVFRAAIVAARYRARFGSDVFIDLLCYRRNGHNEIDEPRFTQPNMYRAIDTRPPVRAVYAERLSTRGLDLAGADAADAALREELDAAHKAIAGYEPNRADAFDGLWSGFHIGSEAEIVASVETGLPLDVLREICGALTHAPDGFALETKAARFLDQRRETIETGEGINWATAEALALASLLREGTHVRMGGQDTPRGAFTQRHLVLHDRDTGARHSVLGESAEIYNSPLIEYAVVAHEYGHSLADPRPLVIWEAQFGDFLNLAQAVFDQFITCGEDRWLRSSGLVMLLPHGLDGGGPDHATARPERLLAACARGNIQVANASTPANYFHLLRRQIHRPFRKPLAVLAPKALLRNRAAVSTLDEMGPGTGFRTVIAEGEGARRVVLCSGKIHYELAAARRARGLDGDIALVRIEQLYPLDEEAIRKALASHPDADLVWCQEEPENMGPAPWLDRRLEAIAGKRLRIVSRPSAATPAPGFPARDEAERDAVIGAALDLA